MERLLNSGEILVTRDIRFANMIGAFMATTSTLGGVILIREQDIVLIKKLWRSFLEDPDNIMGMIVLTKRGTRRRSFQ